MTDEPIEVRLRTLALCETDHPADAVSALMHGAAVVLHPMFGPAGAIAIMRDCLTDMERAIGVASSAPEQPPR